MSAASWLLVVYLINGAGLTDPQLNQAKQEVERLFADANITVSWALQPGNEDVRVGLVGKKLVGCNTDLGCAVAEARLVWVDVPSARQYEFDGGLPNSMRIVARVIAHEIAHVYGLRNDQKGPMMFGASREFRDPKAFITWDEQEKRQLQQALGSN